MPLTETAVIGVVTGVGAITAPVAALVTVPE